MVTLGVVCCDGAATIDSTSVCASDKLSELTIVFLPDDGFDDYLMITTTKMCSINFARREMTQNWCESS